MKAVRLCLVLGIGLLLSLSAWAKAFVVHGRIYEASTDAGLPRLTLKLVPPRTARAQEFVTSTRDDGAYQIVGVPQGRYTLRVLQGLNVVYSEAVEISGDVTRDIALEAEPAPGR